MVGSSTEIGLVEGPTEVHERIGLLTDALHDVTTATAAIIAATAFQPLNLSKWRAGGIPSSSTTRTAP
jgi:hypothetical protein